MCPPEIRDINEAELYAIVRSLWLLEKHMEATGYELIYVRTDSANTVNLLTKGDHSGRKDATGKMVRYIRAVLDRNKWRLNIKHVKSHQRNASMQAYMNNQADAMAKQVHNRK